MNILIINQPLRNRGDESAHKALIRKIKTQIPNVSIRVLFINCSSTDSICQFDVHLPNVTYINSEIPLCGLLIRLYKLHLPLLMFLNPFFILNMWTHYRWADAVVCAPGGICMGGFQNWGHIFQLYVAKLARKPLSYFGRSFGPFPTATKSNRLFKKRSMELLNYFSFISIRDKKTEAIAKELGITYTSTVDSAFLDSTTVELPYELRYFNSLDNYMVYVPNLLLWHFAYKGKFEIEDVLSFYTQMARIILEQDKNQKIVMLPQTFQYRVKYGDDIDLFREIACQINDDRVIVLPDCYSSDIQQKIISRANYVVGARYHSIVFAINQNVPFVSLSYEHKMSGLLETLQMTETMIDISHTLETLEGRNRCLKEFTELIGELTHDHSLHGKAKKMAEQAFESFHKVLVE